MGQDKGIERSLERLKAAEITERNRQIILKFHDFCFSSGLNPGTISKYLCYLPKMAKILGA